MSKKTAKAKAAVPHCHGCQRRAGDPQPPRGENSKKVILTVLDPAPRGWPVADATLCQSCRAAFLKHVASSPMWRTPNQANNLPADREDAP